MKNKRIILGSSLLALCLPFLAACSNSEKVTTLRILNMEDYIYFQNRRRSYGSEVQ